MSQKKSRIDHGKYGFELWFWCNCTPNIFTIAFVPFKRRIQQLFLIDNSSLKVKHRRGGVNNYFSLTIDLKREHRHSAYYIKQSVYCLCIHNEFSIWSPFFSLMWDMNNAVVQQFKSTVCLNTITNKHSFTAHSFLKITLSEFYTVVFEHFVKKRSEKTY